MAKTLNYKDILKRMAKSWILCYGMITIQVVAGYWLNTAWLPYLGLALIGVIILYGNHILGKTNMHCSIITHYTVYTLFLSGVLMLLITLFGTRYFVIHYPLLATYARTFQSAYVVYPIATIMFGVSLLRRDKTRYCKACRITANISIAESMRCNVLHHESKFQLWLSFAVSLFLSVEVFVFYFLFNNVYKDAMLHSPGLFFLYVSPAVVYAISVAYIFIRYSSLEFEISLKMSQLTSSRTSRIRYMVIWRDSVLLHDIVDDKTHGSYWDTPADVPICFQSAISEHQAFVEFRNLSGIENFKLKWLYATSHTEQNVFHYAVFIDDDVEEAKGRMSGEWMTLRDVDMLLKSGCIARPFASEIHRVFTITMAWKTYDNDGHRLYPIKNYRPTFRLRDFHTWDVDYEDMHLMSIAENNEDKPFFRFRRFWRRYINGMDKRWDKK